MIIGFRDLVNNAWFSRIWVVQEAALAKNLFVQAGSRRVPWTRFVACVRSVKEMDGIPLAETPLVYDIETLRQQKLSDDLEYSDLLMIMEVFRGRQATDLRDKIYGLFGLIKQDHRDRPFKQTIQKVRSRCLLTLLRGMYKSTATSVPSQSAAPKRSMSRRKSDPVCRPGLQIGLWTPQATVAILWMTLL